MIPNNDITAIFHNTKIIPIQCFYSNRPRQSDDPQ